jgi:chloramphenicol 3-O-phosphotransferase
MVQKLVILRGAPASGKTTISEKLRDFDNKIVWFKTDSFKQFFSSPGEDRILDEIMETCLATLCNLLDRGYSVIYEGIFQKAEYVQKTVDIGISKNVPVVIYQLSCSLEILKERDRNRKGIKEGCRKPLGDEAIENLFKKLKENPINGAIKLDTQNTSLEDCIEIIRKNFN